MKDITLTREESRLFEEAVATAARVYHERANYAARGAVPAFGVDDQPADTSEVDAVNASALMVTMAALADVRDDLYKTRTGTEQRGPLAMSFQWASEEDETDIETVTTLHLGVPATAVGMLLLAVFNANICEQAPAAQLALLERLTSQ